MCIDDSLALHAKSKDGYIKHLEEYLLDSCHYYQRCEHCKRVEHTDVMASVVFDDDSSFDYVCETCAPAAIRAFEEAQEIAESDKRDYRDAKGRV
jgi:hypothetical protein